MAERLRPRIAVMGLGGTIAMTRDMGAESSPKLTTRQLLVSVPGIAREAEIVPIDVDLIAGRELSLDHICGISHRIHAEISRGADGIVVISGTDTLEELAYGIALQVEPQVPIAVTGAMREADRPGADGPGNLSSAVHFVLSSGSLNLGPVIVMHDEVHLARWATKIHTTRLKSFSSLAYGPAGYVLGDEYVSASHPSSNDYLGLPASLRGRVEIVWLTAGMDSLVIQTILPNVQGLVIAGTGAGNVSDEVASSLTRGIDTGKAVVLASRCPSGPVIGDMAKRLHERGVLPAGEISAVKARLRLLVGLALGMDLREVFPV